MHNIATLLHVTFRCNATSVGILVVIIYALHTRAEITRVGDL